MIWWPRQIPKIGHLPISSFIVAIVCGTSFGSPGPLEIKIPSGDSAKIVSAEATKKANDLMKQSLTDELIAKQFIEKWDGKLPSTYAGEDILGIFNIK